MNPSVKARWVQALRSGDFKQTTGVLQRLKDMGHGETMRPAGHCCLGVLCEIAVQDGVIEKWRDENVILASFDHENKVLPGSVMRWAGLESNDPRIDAGEILGKHSLSHFNDTTKLDFNQIADLIEENL